LAVSGFTDVAAPEAIGVPVAVLLVAGGDAAGSGAEKLRAS
jgi:hypothetical protein